MSNLNFTFITENNSENNETVYYAIDSANIETINVSDTYTQYGQKVSADDAGDSVELLSEKAAKVANDAYNEPYTTEDDFEYNEYVTIGDSISAYDNWNAFNAVIELLENVDYCSYKLTVNGMTYWDGHNYQTITIDREDGGEPSHIALNIKDDSDLIEKLNNAIENREFQEERFGKKVYKFEDVEMVYNYCQGSFSSYEITIDENYNDVKELEITDCTVTAENGMFTVEVEFNRNINEEDWAEIRTEVYNQVYKQMPERFKGTTDEDGFRFYEEIEGRQNEMQDEWQMSEPSMFYSDSIALEIDCVETFEDDEEDEN